MGVQDRALKLYPALQIRLGKPTYSHRLIKNYFEIINRKLG